MRKAKHYFRSRRLTSSENSGKKSTENEQNKRKRSIVILEDDEIEEFQSEKVAKNTVAAAWLAQLVERRTAVREVEGLSPRPDQHSGS